MSKIETYQTWEARVVADGPPGYTPSNHRAYNAGFAAGARAEREKVLQEIADIQRDSPGLSNAYAAAGVEAAMNLLHRRISEREDTNG